MTTIAKFPSALRAASLAASLATSLAACSPMLPATPAGAAQVTMEQAVALHEAARDGDDAATARAVEAFEALVAAQPENPLANAYLGSSYALTARDARSVVDKVRFTNRGLRHLDTAVALAPNDFAARLIRANVTVALPTVFGRRDAALKDMMALDAMFDAARSPSMAGPMLGIYAQLETLAPEQADWAAKIALARTILGQ